MTKLNRIEGIGWASAERLRTAGIDSVEKLLNAGSTPDGRKQISANTGISSRRILGWVNRADLARVKGIGEEYADLLDAAGVGSVPSLASLQANNLHQKLVEVNGMKRLVRRVPALSRVESWVEQAKDLPQVVNY